MMKLNNCFAWAVLATSFALGGCQGQNHWFQRTTTTGRHADDALKSHSGKIVPVSIFKQVHGNDKILKNPGITLINSDADLRMIDAKSLYQISVNFKTQSMLLLRVGEHATAGYWAHFVGVQKQAGSLLVQAVVNRPSAKQLVTQQITYAYVVAVVDKVAGQLIPEIDSVEGQKMPSTQ